MDGISRGPLSSKLINTFPSGYGAIGMLLTCPVATWRRRSFSRATALVVLVLIPPAIVRAGETRNDTKPANKPIDFTHDIAPILQKRCAKCHTGTQKKGGFSLNTRQSVLAGGDGGPVVVPRKSAESALIERVISDDANERMPPEGERLTSAQIDLLHERVRLDDASYSFKHALIQEAAYEGLSASERQALHAAVARTLEALHAGRPDEACELVAHHYRSALLGDGSEIAWIDDSAAASSNA
jgi:hypothetical protein